MEPRTHAPKLCSYGYRTRPSNDCGLRYADSPGAVILSSSPDTQKTTQKACALWVVSVSWVEAVIVTSCNPKRHCPEGPICRFGHLTEVGIATDIHTVARSSSAVYSFGRFSQPMGALVIYL